MLFKFAPTCFNYRERPLAGSNSENKKEDFFITKYRKTVTAVPLASSISVTFH